MVFQSPSNPCSDVVNWDRGNNSARLGSVWERSAGTGCEKKQPEAEALNPLYAQHASWLTYTMNMHQ